MTLEQAQRYFVDGQRPRETEPINEEQMPALADAMPQIVWSARADGCLDYYNARWYEFTGFRRGEGGDESWEPILHPDDVQRCLDGWHRAVRTGAPYEMECRLRDHRTGQYRWHLGRALPCKNARGMVKRWFGTWTDIHEQKEALRALEAKSSALHESDRRKGEFLAMLSHELRNPLCSVVNAVDLLRTEKPEHRAWATEVIARQAGQMTRLIDDLLDLTSIDRGMIRLNKEPLDLADVLDRAIETTQPVVTQQQHQLATDYPRRALFVEADPARLEQVLVNLLNNAAKYTPAGGHLSLRATRHHDELAVVVQDDGLGISPEKLPEIFNLFSQGDRSGRHSRDGLGVGLTIVQKLVELHGGSVCASSAGAGRGAEFTVRLPAATTKPPPPHPCEA